MDVENLSRWAEIKGINLVGTGDFTHPNYFAELKLRLVRAEEGLYRLKKGNSATRFILTTEVSHIFSQKGKSHRIHTIIFAPDLGTASKINSKLSKMGNLSADGRPILGQPVKELVKLVLDISEKCFLVPAHAWTPWFSLFGANSGFDSIEECFEEEGKNIYCIETGLSSDPPMNWRLSALDKIALISNSDAHSPRKIGREANVFDCDLNYSTIIHALKTKDPTKLLYTIEFFPEEGKYHYDGHRDCKIIFSPDESKKHNNICPRCKKKLTIGVCHRVDTLADRPVNYKPDNPIGNKYLIPLEEVIADALEQNVGTQAVDEQYHKLIARGKNEFNILLDVPIEELKLFAPQKIAEGIRCVREGRINIVPGYDGVFGKISIFRKLEDESNAKTVGYESNSHTEKIQESRTSYQVSPVQPIQMQMF
jgi:uncharacterized protein (TIGR00375 family)